MNGFDSLRSLTANLGCFVAKFAPRNDILNGDTFNNRFGLNSI